MSTSRFVILIKEKHYDSDEICMLCSFWFAALGSMSFRAKAYTERNMLQKMADEATLKDMLVLKQAWVPYPAYTDRAAWDSLTQAPISNISLKRVRSYLTTNGS